MNRRDRRTKRSSVGVEPLEGRMLLSTSGAMIVPLKGAPTYRISYLDLQGSAHGTPSTVVGNPDVGTTVDFRGSGVVTGLGALKINGSLNGTGFFANSHVEGRITLSNAKGSFILQLQSPSVGGFTAPRSGTYDFDSTSGTGAYKKDFGNGTVVLVLKSSSFTLDFDGKPNVY